MSDKTEVANKVACLLRVIADKIEAYPEILKDSELIAFN